MDGRFEVWICSLTRFVWHSLLLRSWIACFGLLFPLIVSFLDDGYSYNWSIDRNYSDFNSSGAGTTNVRFNVTKKDGSGSR